MLFYHHLLLTCFSVIPTRIHSCRYGKQIAFLVCISLSWCPFLEAQSILVVMDGKVFIQETQSSRFDATLGLTLSTDQTFRPGWSVTTECQHIIPEENPFCAKKQHFVSPSLHKQTALSCRTWWTWQMDMHLSLPPPTLFLLFSL